MSLTKVSNALIDLASSTDALSIPKGTTAQRPSSPTVGLIRYNTTESAFETYTGSSWVKFSTVGYSYSATYLNVAGGGGGGNFSGAGAGGLLTNTLTLLPTTIYTITVGAGGAGNSRGSDSVIAGSNISTVTSLKDASGYGGINNNAGGDGISGQGYAGGYGKTDSATYNSGGGGGGSGSVGGNSGGTTTGYAGVGGSGTASSITGSSVTYAGGGGGGGDNRQGIIGGAGGSGGGGAGGSVYNSWSGQNATANTGSGGGGAGYVSGSYGTQGQGGSGVFILSVPTANYSGTVTGSPTVTTSGSNTIIKFTSSGTYTA
jgi:hypothetical protein